MFVRTLLAVVAFWCTCLVSMQVGAYTPPPIDGHVTDPARRLTDDEKSAIDQKLARYRNEHGDQIAVLIAASLEGETIEDVAYSTFNAWKLGQKKKDNGVLLVIAPTERRNRIETGKGIGDRLTDLQSKDILRQRVTPRCQELRWRAAVDDGVEAIMAVLQGKPMPPSSLSEPAKVNVPSTSEPAPTPRREPTSTPTRDPFPEDPKNSFGYKFMNDVGFFFGTLFFATIIGGIAIGFIWTSISARRKSRHGSSSSSDWSSPSTVSSSSEPSSFASSAFASSAFSSPSTSESPAAPPPPAPEPKFTGGGGSSGGGGASDSW